MQTSDNGKEFIRIEEGLTLTVKGDTGGKQEIGYGHDILPSESFPNGITEAYAEQILTVDLAKVDAAINSHNLTFTQNQHDALADFTYECGDEALAELLAHGVDQITTQLPYWVHAHVKGVLTVLPGMVARRAREVVLFNS